MSAGTDLLPSFVVLRGRGGGMLLDRPKKIVFYPLLFFIGCFFIGCCCVCFSVAFFCTLKKFHRKMTLKKKLCNVFFFGRGGIRKATNSFTDEPAGLAETAIARRHPSPAVLGHWVLEWEQVNRAMLGFPFHFLRRRSRVKKELRAVQRGANQCPLATAAQRRGDGDESFFSHP